MFFPLRRGTGTSFDNFKNIELQDRDAAILDCVDPNSIIMNYLKTTINIASVYATIRPRLKDDILSVAIMALVEGANELPEENKEKFLLNKIERACINFVFTDDVVRMAASTRHKKKVRTQSLPDNYHKRYHHSDLFFLLEDCAKTEFEKKAIRLKIRGCFHKEIAEKLNLSESDISLLVNRVIDRFINA